MAQKRLINLFLVLAATMMVASCGSEEGKIKSEFVAGCTSQGAPKDMCKCAYDKLRSRYSYETMVAMKEQGVTPPDYVEALFVASSQCRAGDTSATLVLPSDAKRPVEGDDLADGPNAALSLPDVGSSGKAESDAPASSPEVDEAVMESAIAAVANSEGGEEYTDARETSSGDLNGDGMVDTAVLYTIEVGSENRYTRFLSTFLRQTDGVLKYADTTPVGGKGGDAVTGVMIENGSLKLETLTMGPDDANCCPSLEGTAEYLLHNGKIKRVE